MKAFKAFIKPSAARQRSVKIKIQGKIFYFNINFLNAQGEKGQGLKTISGKLSKAVTK